MGEGEWSEMSKEGCNVGLDVACTLKVSGELERNYAGSSRTEGGNDSRAFSGYSTLESYFSSSVIGAGKLLLHLETFQGVRISATS